MGSNPTLSATFPVDQAPASPAWRSARLPQEAPRRPRPRTADRKADDMSDRLGREGHEVDVCVIGGGMAGLCAAIASARTGARTALVQDRPVLGGNASSEVRMHICGAHGEHNKETGILEELQLANLDRNTGLVWPVWDHVLWAAARFQPGLELLLNASVTDAACEGDRIASVRAWQGTTQVWHEVRADLFIDCSGDSILAACTPAAWREGRESADEFGEDIEPQAADGKTMGNSILIQVRRTDRAQPFVPPRWAYKFTRPEDLPHRLDGVEPRNFWWLEIGGLDDTIGDAERLRDELLKIAYGVWDYIKNYAPERKKAANWAIHWVGSVPGKREGRRYEGDHILTQRDVEAGGRFDDVVAFGGWTMDDHHPAGILYPGKPTIFHPAPSPFGIPLRCLYSQNVEDLLFAGRNISVTHAALSATRVMATCSVIGQAAGTAAALCARHGCTPRGLHERHLAELQRTLMDDDCFLPGFVRQVDPLSAAAALGGQGQGLANLLDGHDRDRPGEPHGWTGPLGEPVELRWDRPVEVGGLRLVFDSDLNDPKRMPHAYPVEADRPGLPGRLLRAFRVEVEDEGGAWRTVHRERENRRRLVRLPVRARTAAVRFVPEATWGDEEARVFSLEATARGLERLPDPPEGPPISEVREALGPSDLAPPAKGQG